MDQRTTILCLASYEKGADFLRHLHRAGCRVHLVTVEKLRGIEWPHDALDGFHVLPDEHTRLDVIHGVSWLARTVPFHRIVALDEFDLETAAALRQHLRIPGLTETETQYFRDKLAMRERAAAGGVRVPDFHGIFHHAELAAFLDRTAGPWMVKPRTEASAVGIHKLDSPDAIWPILDTLGDRQSFHLVERYIAGDVYHVDSVVHDGRAVFAEVHRYARPPFDVMHAGGLFCSRTVERDDSLARAMRDANQAVVDALGFRRGVLHTEFIHGAGDGGIYFIETAARVGGANIVETVEAATGVNLWREWADIELAQALGTVYSPPRPRADHAGVLISLARQEWPDTSSYDDPEVVWRLRKRHHAGLIVASPDPDRVGQLLDAYMARFYDDFHAVLPAPDKPTA